MDFNPIDSKKRWLQQLLQQVTGGAGADLKARHAPPPPAPAPTVPVPGFEGMQKPADSDIELLADLVPSNVHIDNQPSEPVDRWVNDKLDPESGDKKFNAKLERDKRENDEEGV